MELFDEICGHKTLRRLEQLVSNMIILDNDLFSYNAEQARGDDAHNLVRVVMELGLALQELIDCIGRRHERLVGEFLKLYGTIPETFPGNENVRSYAGGVSNWVRGN
jgi:hypothetical protein